MDIPQDDGSIRRTALQRLRDSFSNKVLDAEAMQSSMERDNPMLSQISKGMAQGGVMPVGGLGSAVEGATTGLAEQVGGQVVRPNTGYGGIVNAPAKELSEAATQLANKNPNRIDPRTLMDIYKRFK
jgi:hypothetical protein